MIAAPVHAEDKSSTMLEDTHALAAATDAIAVTLNVVDIVLNDEHRTGVDWGAIVSDFHTVPLKKEDNSAWSDKKYRLSVGSLSEDDYGVLLDALDTVGKVTQHPQSTTSIHIGEGEALPVGDDKIKLQVTLKRNKDSQLTVHIEPTFNLTSYDSKIPGRPTVLNLMADTDEVVLGTSTIVLGSIFEEQEITKTHKFPLLGDLPLVGLVFRSQGRLMQKTEKIIFLTITAPSAS